MTRFKAIKELLENELSNIEMIEIYNEYAIENRYEQICPMDMFDEMFEGMAPSDIARNIFNGKFSPHDDYFIFDVYLESFDWWNDEESPISSYDLAKYIDEEDDALGNGTIQNFLDEWTDEESDDEE